MTQIWELVRITWQTFTLMFTDLRYILILALVFSIVYRQYSKKRTYEQEFFGLRRTDPLRETAAAAIYGLGGGLLATALFIVFGVSPHQLGSSLSVAGCHPVDAVSS
jgi:hypothetical protein